MGFKRGLGNLKSLFLLVGGDCLYLWGSGGKIRRFGESGEMQRGDGEEICPFIRDSPSKFFFKSCTPSLVLTLQH